MKDFWVSKEAKGPNVFLKSLLIVMPVYNEKNYQKIATFPS